jgi:hypothetical protein
LRSAMERFQAQLADTARAKNDALARKIKRP